MITYRLHTVYLVLLLLVISCSKKESKETQIAKSESIYDTIALPKIDGLKPKLGLTREAQNVTENWVFYQEISQIINSLGPTTIGRIKKQIPQLSTIYANLKESQVANESAIPVTLNTQAIRARLAALETQLMMLKNEVFKNEPSSGRIAKSIVKSKNALQDLNLQIDERFALSIEEMLEAASESNDTLTIKKGLVE